MHVHMLGICGTAMAALAGTLQAQGHRVTGSDNQVYPPMSDHLDALGIVYHQGYKPENIPQDADLVVVGNVIQESNPEAQAMRDRGLEFVSMAQAIKQYAIGERRTVAMVGTHGKTTTTALAAHVLVSLGADPGFLIGGIAKNFGTNFRLGEGRVFVIEGDEYDTAYFDKTPKFFKYQPDIVILTSLEFDHADIYQDLGQIKGLFRDLLVGMPKDGLVIACVDDANVAEILPEASCQALTYGFSPQANFQLSQWETRQTHSSLHTSHGPWQAEWRLPMAGRHNAQNVGAVVALARHLGYDDSRIQTALDSFQGVKRRQEVRGEVNGITVIDDFAHHPTAVALTIEAMQHKYPGRRLWAVFEPRSFTARSNRFQKEFQQALSAADRVLLARPYASGYSSGITPMDTVAMAGSLESEGSWAMAPENTDALLDVLSRETATGDVVLIMSNGGFDNLHERLLESLA